MSTIDSQQIWNAAIRAFPYPLNILKCRAGKLKPAIEGLAYMESYTILADKQAAKAIIYSWWQDRQLQIAVEILPDCDRRAYLPNQDREYVGRYHPSYGKWILPSQNVL